MSQSVASTLEVVCMQGEDRLFIRNVDKFFDCLNVKSPILGKLKQNENILPYRSPSDERFKVATKNNCKTQCHQLATIT